MGLSLIVGVIPTLHAEAEEGARQACRDEFAAVSRVLKALGLPEHQEPERLPRSRAWECEVGHPVCIHFLRRIAAHLALGKALPDPAGGNPAHDPIIEQYAASCRALVRRETQAGPAQLSLPIDVPIPAVPVIEGPGFEHLMWHSDYTGYYLPIPFSQVIVLPNHSEWAQYQCGPWLGSSHALLRECEQLAEALRYPQGMHIEELRQQPPDPTASDWRRYAVECFMCRALIAACEASISTGCAVVFC